MRPSVGTLVVEGLVAARYLEPDTASQPPAPVTSDVPPALMPVDRGSGIRAKAARCAYPLNEPGQPTRQGADEATVRRELTAIVE